MDKDLSLTNLAKNMRGNLYKAYTTDKELTHGLMEKNTLENIKMMNFTDKEFLYFQKEHIRLMN